MAELDPNLGSQCGKERELEPELPRPILLLMVVVAVTPVRLKIGVHLLY